jgi:hypothetical protein
VSCRGRRRVIEGIRTPPFGTTIRIARLHYPSCLSRKAGDLRVL